MTTEVVNVEQCLQILRYKYHFELRLKEEKISLVPTTKFSEQQLEEINKLKEIIKSRKAEAVGVLSDTRDRFVETLKQQQMYCKDNYDGYFNDPEIYVRYMSCFEDFQHTEQMLLRDFDYGLECIWNDVCPEAPMCCEYCSKDNRWRNNNG